MKQTIILTTLLFTIVFSACKKQETCAAYSKETKVVKIEKEKI